MIMAGTCFCNAHSTPRCCIIECDEPRSGRGGCFPCNAFRNTDTCLQTGQNRAERRRGASGG